MARLITFLFCFLSVAETEAQRFGQASFVSLSQMSDMYFLLRASEPASKQVLPCKQIKFIDNRYDKEKLGFFPVYKQSPKIIRLNDNLPAWLQMQFNTLFTKDETQPRQLMIAVQKLWFSTEAYERFSLLKQRLQIVLYYNLEVYSVSDKKYFPIKRFEGNFRTTFREEYGYKALTDSLFILLQKELPAIDYNLRESKLNSLDSIKVFQYFNEKKSNMNEFSIPRGVYASFEDFRQGKIVGDTVETLKREEKNDYPSVPLACHFGVYVQGELQSCNKFWGYYDGRYLFVNSGNGLFIRLRPWNGQFILADLQVIAMQSKHKSTTNDVYIGKSSYENIRDFAKTYHLFFQLDFDEGKLF